jgi:acyl-CoA dehydrogenase
MTSPESPWNTPERPALRALVRDFTRREIVPNIGEWERAGAVPRSLHAKAAELGLLGVATPSPWAVAAGTPSTRCSSPRS